MINSKEGVIIGASFGTLIVGGIAFGCKARPGFIIMWAAIGGLVGGIIGNGN